jgi:hypothetical protein
MGEARARGIGIAAAAVALLLLGHGSLAQREPSRKPAPSPAAADRLGLTCAKILEIPSTEWVAKFNKEKDATAEGTARAVATYGECYDARTDTLAAGLAKRGASPPRNARVNFLGLENALQEFMTEALADAQPKPDTTKVAYVHLYEKQFRYEFYQAYAEKSLNRALTPEEDDEFGKAKNRFGELLGLLPEEKAREVHEAFGEVVGTHEVSLPMKLALYRYAILILEPLSEKPFAPPPF